MNATPSPREPRASRRGSRNRRTPQRPASTPSPAIDAAPVPITLWRVADPEHRQDTGTVRLAAMLIAMYADPGDTVVVIGDDPDLAGAAGAAGCRYHQVARLTDLAELEHLGHRVGILITTWPQPEPGRLPGDAETLFTAGEELVARHGSTIVTLPIRPTEDAYGTHGWRLLTEAEHNGFQLYAHVIFVDPETPAEHRSGAQPPEAARTDLRPRRHVLIFAPPGRDPQARSQTAGRRTARARRQPNADRRWI